MGRKATKVYSTTSGFDIKDAATEEYVESYYSSNEYSDGIYLCTPDTYISR